MKVAAIQMVSTADVQINLQQARRLLVQAAQAGAELAVLPEYFCLMARCDADKLQIQEPLGDGPVQAFLAGCARELGLWLVGGTLPLSAPGRPVEPGPERVFNAVLVFSPYGERVCSYHKIHLFRFDNGQERYDESLVLQPGVEPVSFDLPSRDGHTWRIGLSVCYDLRFPELYRRYASAGAHLLLAPSAFTHTTGQAHWELLLRARAIENLCFVAAAAQGGQHENGRRTWGQSLVAGPWGQVLAQQAQEPGVVLADLDMAELDACRQRLPALQHRVL